MIATILFIAALLLVFLAGQMGMKAGAFPALIQMITAVLSLFITMRYWFPLTRLASACESSPLYLLTLFTFWTVFLPVFYIILTWCNSHLETFEPVRPSIFGRILGATFGCVSGAVFVTALMMTLSLLAPQVLPSYKPDALPLPIDTAPEIVFRMVETRVARVKANDPARTLLPKFENAGSSDPAVFWQ